MKLLQSQERSLPCGCKRMNITFEDELALVSRSREDEYPVARRCPRCKRRFRVRARICGYTEERTRLEVYRLEWIEEQSAAPKPVV